MKLIRRLLSYISRRSPEQDNREIYGYTTWHPDFGHVYCPPTRVPANEYNMDWKKPVSNDN